LTGDSIRELAGEIGGFYERSLPVQAEPCCGIRTTRMQKDLRSNAACRKPAFDRRRDRLADGAWEPAWTVPGMLVNNG